MDVFEAADLNACHGQTSPCDSFLKVDDVNRKATAAAASAVDDMGEHGRVVDVAVAGDAGALEAVAADSVAVDCVADGAAVEVAVDAVDSGEAAVDAGEAAVDAGEIGCAAAVGGAVGRQMIQLHAVPAPAQAVATGRSHPEVSLLVSPPPGCAEEAGPLLLLLVPRLLHQELPWAHRTDCA